MRERALVRNAADPEQVKRAGRVERDREALFLAALHEVLEYASGRLVFADLLDRAGLYGTVYDASDAAMYFKEGRRNFGLELRAACERANEAGTDLMDRERRARLQKADAATDAAHRGRAETAEQPTEGAMP